MTNVVLIGFMAVGKTTLGRALAQSLGRVFVDLDELIEKEAGHSIAWIFENEGEDSFRAHETRILEKVLADSNQVISTGGGTPIRAGAMDKMLNSGTVFWLRATPETVSQRVGDGESRPLLAGLGPVDRQKAIGLLLAERETHYGKAHVQIDTDDRDPRWLVNAMLQHLPRE
jgi:shikimate kinase